MQVCRSHFNAPSTHHMWSAANLSYAEDYEKGIEAEARCEQSLEDVFKSIKPSLETYARTCLAKHARVAVEAAMRAEEARVEFEKSAARERARDRVNRETSERVDSERR